MEQHIRAAELVMCLQDTEFTKYVTTVGVCLLNIYSLDVNHEPQ